MNSHLPEDQITSISGIGPKIAEKLEKLGIQTIGDLLKHFPRHYIDFTKQVHITDLKEKIAGSFLATIGEPKTFYSRNGKLITQAVAQDSSGKITLTWFNNPYIKRIILVGEPYSIAGTPSKFGPKLTIISPTIEEGNSFSLNTKGLVPVYPQTEGITSKWLRKKIFEILGSLEVTDPVDQTILEKNKLPALSEAIKAIHFPKEKIERSSADKRLSYNEHLTINIQNRIELEKLGSSVSLKINQDLDKETNKKLPFTLTAGQQKVLKQIETDLKKDSYTHRLIQGETGSGKTAPLLFAAGHAINNGYSCAILAPTEILARQHLSTFQKFFVFRDKVSLVTSSSKAKHGKIPTVFIGTHAILNQIPTDINPALAFVVIDEQHKFGVNQRQELLQRSPVPHLFNLSATPIPRTVALGLLGDIKMSNIKDKPQNRLPVKTFIVTPTKFKNSPKWLVDRLKEGNQIYVVCPHIQNNSGTVSSVETQFAAYRKLIPSEFPIFSVHGKMSHEDQISSLTEFKKTSGSILVATSLIEVGIDIPTANIMIIHSAERFGLAQLHQLRGRVGRGGDQGYCFLVPTVDEDTEKERLQLLQKYHDGLVLAKQDLKLRGAGEIYGNRQHGKLSTRLKYFWSKNLFKKAKKDADSLVLSNPQKALEIASKLQTW